MLEAMHPSSHREDIEVLCTHIVTRPQIGSIQAVNNTVSGILAHAVYPYMYKHAISAVTQSMDMPWIR